ncbi:MAG TPA: hypothetical protein DCR97_08370 [Deltaproteobacteria bacterium]|jgi:hypothetical protein|nr:hypothetical protein [Deltaproteobacteria bacterium]
MEWAQVLAIVIPVMLTIVIGVIYNNKRIDDLRLDIRGFKADTDRRFSDVHDELKEMKADIREIRQFLLRLIPTPEPPKENPR